MIENYDEMPTNSLLYSLSMGSKIGIATLLAKNQKVMNVTLEKSFVKPMKELAEKLK